MIKHPPSLHIVADENIPIDARDAPEWARIDFLPAAALTRERLLEVDALLVRSVTRVDERLLGGTGVSFVGTATTGIDHVDIDYLRERGTAFADAAGSNADSVVDYVLAAVAVAARRARRRLADLTVGIVGVGRIGGRLADRLQAVGMSVLLCDPPRNEAEGGGFVGLYELLSRADVVTLHVPLTIGAPHSTHHMIDGAALSAMRPGAWIMNTSRGAVVDGAALKEVLRSGERIRAVLDVWETEPEIDVELLDLVDLATPHIAGYAYDGKIRGGWMMLEATAEHFGRPMKAKVHSSADDPVIMPPDTWLPETDAFGMLARRMYDIEADDRALRSAMTRSRMPGDVASAFTALRKSYPVRREFTVHRLGIPVAPGHRRVESALGIGLAQTR